MHGWNNLLHKIGSVTIFFILIFGFFNIFLNETCRAKNENTLYVGGNGPGNYSKINDAYNDANPGDTIFVYCGIYYERLRIKKTVNLIGEDKDTTSIIYNSKHWDPIKIWALNVVISGFKIYNPNPDLISYLTLYNGSNNVSISDCIFYNSPLHFDKGSVGICICDSSHHRISNCTFWNLPGHNPTLHIKDTIAFRHTIPLPITRLFWQSTTKYSFSKIICIYTGSIIFIFI